MLDERAHSTDGGLEGRETVSGFFHNIEEDLRAIGESLSLRWDIQTVKKSCLVECTESAHIDSGRRYSQWPRNSSSVAFETWFCLELLVNAST